NPANNTASCTTQVNAPSTSNEADLSITKLANPIRVEVGANVTFTLTVTNNGLMDAAGVVVNDTLPAPLSFVSATTSKGTCNSSNPVSCNVGTLTNGSKATITIVAKALSVGSVTNTGTVTGTTPDNDLANNNASATISIIQSGADLYIQKTASP